MSKKIVLVILFIFTMTVISKESIGSAINTSKLSSGIISINHETQNPSAVRISKGSDKKDYILNGNNSFPLQFGDGEYTVQLLEKVNGNKYKEIKKQVINLNLKNEKDMYLQSVQMVNWNHEMNTIKIAKDLTKEAKTDKEKLTILYNYIIKNIKYDNNKALTVKNEYVPNIEELLISKQGICYDYSTLLASMLRALNIPTKLEMGYKNDIKNYHAWNKVYLKESDEWVLIDTTYDSAFVKKDMKVQMIKNEKEYTGEKQY